MSKQSKKVTQEDIDNYTEAIWLNPRDSDAYYFRGNAKNDLGDLQGAIEDYTEVIRLEPDYHTPAYFFRALASLKLRNYQAAVDDFNETIRLSPDNANAYFNGCDLYLIAPYCVCVLAFSNAVHNF